LQIAPTPDNMSVAMTAVMKKDVRRTITTGLLLT
jgi:hypothetical protein